MQKTYIRSLGLEEPLEKGMATQSSILTWRITWTEEQARPRGHKESGTTETEAFTGAATEQPQTRILHYSKYLS